MSTFALAPQAIDGHSGRVLRVANLGVMVAAGLFLTACECGAAGRWRIVEQGGEMVDAEYLGDGIPSVERPTLLLSEALSRADDAEGPVGISDLSAMSIRLDVDVEVNAIDDEFVFSATGIVIDR